MVLVGRQSPWKTLPELRVALKADPNRISFAAGGTIGSQDWVKSALVAGAGGVISVSRDDNGFADAQSSVGLGIQHRF